MARKNKNLRIVFMGNPEFAVPSLEALHNAGHEIVAVVTGTDKKRGRSNALSPSVVKSKAIELGLPVIEQDTMRDAEFADRLRTLEADLFVVVAFKVLPLDLLSIPSIGSINLHASLLPKYRGAAPIHWAVIRGETETGVTVFFLDEQVDTGKYLLQERVEIGPEDTTGTVYQKLMDLGARTLVHAVDTISRGQYTLIEQNDSQATSAPKIFPEQAKIDLKKRSRDVVNHIRGMNPFPSAWMKVDGKKFKVHRARSLEANTTPISSILDKKQVESNSGHLSEPRKLDDQTGIPNESMRKETKYLANVDGKLVAFCVDGMVEFTEVQLEGKRTTSGEEFLRGYQGDLAIN